MEIKGQYYDIHFQEGPVKLRGKNGCQAPEVLTAIAGYLQDCNKGLPYRETSIAITRIEEAVLWLNERTRRREVQGVKGTNIPHD
jgi:hypothetical protein